MDRKTVLSLLRNLYRELKPTLPMGKKHVLQTGHWKHITALVEKNQTPENTAENRRILRAGHNYLEYLRSTRKYNEIMEKYKGKGERNATDLAHILGFKMPDEPKEPRKPPKQETSS